MAEIEKAITLAEVWSWFGSAPSQMNRGSFLARQVTHSGHWSAAIDGQDTVNQMHALKIATDAARQSFEEFVSSLAGIDGRPLPAIWIDDLEFGFAAGDRLSLTDVLLEFGEAMLQFVNIAEAFLKREVIPGDAEIDARSREMFRGQWNLALQEVNEAILLVADYTRRTSRGP